MRIRTELMGWRAGRRGISTLGCTIHMAQWWERYKRVLRESIPPKPREGRAVHTVFLKTWQADFPEGVHAKIHFSERLISPDSALLQI